jgi:hypothetical protein
MDRAALVKMGKSIEAARACLIVTERRSIQHIAAQEFPRFIHVNKPNDGDVSTKPKSKHTSSNPATGLAAKVANEILKNVEDGNDIPTREEIQNTYGLKESTAQIAQTAVRTAVAYKNGMALPPENPLMGNTADVIEKILESLEPGEAIPTRGEIKERYGLKEQAAQIANSAIRVALAYHAKKAGTPPAVRREDLSETAQSKLDRAIKAEVKRLQGEFARAVHEQSKKDADEFIKSMHPDWRRKIDFANSFKLSREGAYPFTRDEFKKILTCLHPDRIQDDALKARFADAFGTFKSKESVLVMPEPPTGGPDFPTTADDLIKRRK